MSHFIALILVMVCVIGSYVGLGGKLSILNQPFELVIILGGGLAAYVVGSPWPVAKNGFAWLRKVFKGPKYSHDDYIEMLSMQYQIFRLIKQKGVLAIENHIENPKQSTFFSQFPIFQANNQAADFYCDYLRIISLGCDSPHQIEALMDEDLIGLRHRDKSSLTGLVNLGDSLPALGIVAAVLGVIKTMGSISEPPEVLGNLIAGALVGTFLGVLLSYGWFSPLANAALLVNEEEETYMNSLKAGIIAYLNGYAPVVCVEFSRKQLSEHSRPSFTAIEEIITNLPAPQT